MTVYRDARPGEEGKLLDLANMVFSMDQKPHDFRALVPTVYARDDFAPMHVVAEEDGRITAMVGLREHSVMVGEERIACGFIGTVCVHPYERGKGHMKRLMAMAHERARQKGLHLLMLGGQRQRYNYFDFEVGTAGIEFNVTQDNLRHVKSTALQASPRFVPLEGAGPAVLASCFGLFRRQPMHGEREEAQFAQYLRTWQGQGYAILMDGAVAGYTYVVEGGWRECVLSNWDALVPALHAWQLQMNCEETVVSVPYWNMKSIRILSEIAEQVSISGEHMLHVLDWQQVLGVLMAFKGKHFGLAQGELVVQIGEDKPLRLSVQENRTQVKPCDGPAQVRLTHNQAVLRFFSLQGSLMKEEPGFYDWFPLLFSLSEADAF